MAKLKARISMSLSLTTMERHILARGLKGDPHPLDNETQFTRANLIREFENMDRLESWFLRQVRERTYEEERYPSADPYPEVQVPYRPSSKG